ncbi:nucleotidyltransferase domain-containing protein [Deinococcus pimensis]|uniref:nucleotidyltransferase domain-containing protein n=1 Tax=Deinococcus pimensis TaxID=309888 RepID=UPI000489CAB7|nr:nucleotidyltransferase domain-containing protein [Deinococcus pimensis]
MSRPLPHALLKQLVTEFGAPPVLAIALSGSAARQADDQFSDLDLVCYVPASAPTREWLGYRDDRLVSIDHQHVEARLHDLTDPEGAVRAVRPLQRLVPLHDPDGVVERLRQTALDFRWASVAGQGRAYAARTVTHQAEVVQKLLGGLAYGQSSRVWSAATELVNAMTVCIAVWHGVLVDSGNTYAQQVWSFVGEQSTWTRSFRSATGLDEATTLTQRAWSALALYTETAQRVAPALGGPDAEVVARVIERVGAVRTRLVPQQAHE